MDNLLQQYRAMYYMHRAVLTYQTKLKWKERIQVAQKWVWDNDRSLRMHHVETWRHVVLMTTCVHVTDRRHHRVHVTRLIRNYWNLWLRLQHNHQHQHCYCCCYTTTITIAHDKRLLLLSHPRFKQNKNNPQTHPQRQSSWTWTSLKREVTIKGMKKQTICFKRRSSFRRQPIILFKLLNDRNWITLSGKLFHALTILCAKQELPYIQFEMLLTLFQATTTANTLWHNEGFTILSTPLNPFTILKTLI